MLIQDHEVVTTGDLMGLREMIDSLRESLPTRGAAHDAYLLALEERLADLSTVPEDEVDVDVVTMNSEVCVRDTGTGRCEVLTLVYGADADAFGRNVSVLTPLGAAILGARVGDLVEWQTRRGPRRMRIERIVF